MTKDKPVLEKKFNEGLDVDRYLKEGGILATLYLEVQGTDEKVAKKALEKTVFENINAEPEAYILEARMYELRKDKEKKFYSGVAEVKLLTTDFRWFVNVVMRYGPSAIEIIEPDETRLSSDQMHSIVADVSELSQIFTSQIITLMKDEERVAFYNRALGKK